MLIFSISAILAIFSKDFFLWFPVIFSICHGMFNLDFENTGSLGKKYFVLLLYCDTAPFENPPESRGGHRDELVEEEQGTDLPLPSQEEINMLIDEEMSLFPESK